MITDTAVNNLKILIVDDEMDICYLLNGMLKRRHMDTSFANTLFDAIAKLQRDMPSIIFLDNHLPDGLGIDFAKYIKKNYPKVKVALITAMDSSANRARAYENGVDFFVSKPFNSENIFRIVDSIQQD